MNKYGLCLKYNKLFQNIFMLLKHFVLPLSRKKNCEIFSCLHFLSCKFYRLFGGELLIDADFGIKCTVVLVNIIFI